MRNRASNLKSFAALSAFSLLEKVVAFVYQMILAAVLGSGIATDCYYSASQLFDLIDTTVLGALVVVVINRFANICAEKDENAGFVFLSRLNSILSIIMVVLAVVTFVCARPVSYLIAPGFEEIERTELVKCIRIMCVIPPVMVIVTLAQGLLRQKNCFIIVSSRSLFISFCGMAVVLLFSVKDPTNSRLLCYGYVAANLLFSVLLLVRSRQFGKITYKKPAFDEDIRKMLLMSVPAIVSKGIVRISLMVDKIISSTLGQGAVSYLTYAQSLYHIVSNLLIVNLCTIMLTDLTNLCVKKKYDDMMKKLRSSILSILLILAPVSLLTVCFSKEIVTIAYQRGAFGEESTKMVATLLFFYAFGFISSMFNSLYTQVLHAFGKMNIAMRNSVVSISLNIAISIVASHFVGIAGIAIGTTISASVGVLLYRRSVQKCLQNYKPVLDGNFIFKLLGGLAGCGAVIAAVKLLIKSAILSFATATVLGFAVFAAVLLLLREETLMGYVKKIRKA